MKGLWKRPGEQFFEDDEGAMKLSKTDKSSLLCGAFIICVCTVLVACGIYHIRVAKANAQAERELYTFLDTVTTYLTSATDDEYDEIAQQLRDDLVLTKYHQNIREYVHDISNTAEGCCAEQGCDSPQLRLVCTNTGELYSLCETDEDSLRFAYDEISETNAIIKQLTSEDKTVITFAPGKGIVSIHRMKGLFCDNCIDKILAAVDGHRMPEFVLFDPENEVYYAVSEGTQHIGGNGHEIEVRYEIG